MTPGLQPSIVNTPQQAPRYCSTLTLFRLSSISSHACRRSRHSRFTLFSPLALLPFVAPHRSPAAPSRPPRLISEAWQALIRPITAVYPRQRVCSRRVRPLTATWQCELCWLDCKPLTCQLCWHCCQYLTCHLDLIDRVYTFYWLFGSLLNSLSSYGSESLTADLYRLCFFDLCSSHPQTCVRRLLNGCLKLFAFYWLQHW